MFSTQYDKIAKLWSGRKIIPLYNPKISVTQVVLKVCQSNGSKIAQVIKFGTSNVFFYSIPTQNSNISDVPIDK